MTTGGFTAGLTAFVTATLTFVLLLFVLAAAVATAQEGVIKGIRAHLNDVRRWGGIVLIGVGLWFILLSVFADFFADIFPV